MSSHCELLLRTLAMLTATWSGYLFTILLFQLDHVPAGDFDGAKQPPTKTPAAVMMELSVQGDVALDAGIAREGRGVLQSAMTVIVDEADRSAARVPRRGTLT